MARTSKALQNGNSALHMASDFADSANQALHAGYDHAAERLGDMSSYALKRGRKVADTAQGYAAEVVPGTARFVRANPLLAVGIAVGVGLFLGLSAKR